MNSTFDVMDPEVSLMTKPMKIVVVDDEEQITELIKTFIEITSGSAQVQTFNDPVIARDYILSNSFDVLITDYKMPGIDGIQLLRLAPPTVKKVLISGYVSEIAEEQLRGMNAQYFEKPVPIRALKKLITDFEVSLQDRI